MGILFFQVNPKNDILKDSMLKNSMSKKSIITIDGIMDCIFIERFTTWWDN